MKLKFLATGIAPTFYEFEDEKIIFNGESFDLSVFEEGDIFEGIEHEMQAIREVERIDGELYVTLCQEAPAGHWRGTDEWINSTEYNPNKMYIREATEIEVEESEKPWVM